MKLKKKGVVNQKSREALKLLMDLSYKETLKLMNCMTPCYLIMHSGIQMKGKKTKKPFGAF